MNLRPENPPVPEIGRPGLQASAWKIAFWMLPLLLGALQLWATLTSMHQIRYEELAESVRNVFWLDHGLVYDGGSTNLGWYATLLAVYKLFGFSLYTAKFVRLGFYLAGLYCAADLLRRWVGIRTAILPLIVIGLSPALLYFNTLQTSNGLDLAWAAICLWLALSVRFQAPVMPDLLKQFLCWLLASLAAMSYPTFLFYLPVLLLGAGWRFKARKKDAASAAGIGYLLAGIAGFLVPLAVAFVFIRNPGLVIHDPVTATGLYRGGGKFSLDWGVWEQSVAVVLRDLFVQGRSYYFEVTRPDFSGILALTGLGWVGGTAIYLGWTGKSGRRVLLAAMLLGGLSLVLPSFCGGAGLRRCTGILAAYFVVYAAVWNFYLNTAYDNPWLRRAGLLLCLLLPAAGVLKFPPLLADLRQPSGYRDEGWFAVAGTPVKSLDYFLAGAARGRLALSQSDHEGRPVACRYSEIYSAVAGYRLWNGLPPVEIQGYDWETKKMMTLAPLPAARLEYESPYAQAALGLALEERGDLAGALVHLQAAAQLEPAAVSCRRLGALLDKMGRPADAIKAYEAALKFDPQDAEAHNGLGIILAGQGRLEEAAAQLRAALVSAPADADVHCNLGNVLAGQGRQAEAVQEYEEALRLYPNNGHAENNLASVLADLGRVDEALAHYQAAVRLEPDAALARFNYGSLLARAGRRDEAVAQLREAVRLQPDYPEARAGLRELNVPMQ